MIPGSGSVIFLLFVLVTVPIISNKFLKVYRLRQEKSTNVRFLFVLFSITTILFFIMLRGNILLQTLIFKFIVISLLFFTYTPKNLFVELNSKTFAFSIYFVSILSIRSLKIGIIYCPSISSHISKIVLS